MTVKDDNRDQIIAYLKNPDADESQLSDKQKELLQYYIDAYAIIRNYESIPNAISVLIKISKLKGKPISSATARRYIHDAIDVIGLSSEIKREGIRNLTAEIIRDAIAIAKAQNDPKTMIQGAKELANLYGSEDPEAPNFDLLEPHLYQIMLDPQAMQLLLSLTQRGSINLDELSPVVPPSEIQDAEIVE